MKLRDEALLIYRQNQPMRAGYVAQFTDLEEAFLEAIDRRFDAFERKAERVASKIHRLESHGDEA